MNCLKYVFKYQKCYILTRRFAVQAKDFIQNVKVHVYNDNEGLSVLSLNRSERKNALSISLLGEINTAIDDLSNSNTRVVIIKSNVSGTFCAGADLKERATLSNKQLSLYNLEIRATMNRIQDLPIPVIAAMDGHALGGGLELALVCDIRVAVASAKYGLVETSHGIIPGAGGTVRLPRLINPAIAKELIFTAKVIDGTEAKDLGLVNHVVDQNDAGNAAFLKCVEIAKAILSNGPVAIRMAKFAINKGIEVDVNAALAFEELCYAQTIPTKDRIEGLKAFAEKRSPKYIGE
ncbi:hypothetical protein RN001_014143 [Aquatica leii]|uniref:Uncharacterized protein n=1 Tax=Aquatica leii TaxID=1421715 RepID=A0AAN7SLX0_9COLE|nr:hypothetical protein RN001_014143 [Aquatica leii]